MEQIELVEDGHHASVAPWSVDSLVYPRQDDSGHISRARSVDVRPGRLNRAKPSPPSKLRRALVCTDGAALAASWALVIGLHGAADASPALQFTVVVGITLAALGLLKFHQLYLARICRVRAVEVARLARVAGLVGTLTYLVGGRVHTGVTARVAFEGALLSFLVLAVTRSAYTSWLKRLRCQGKVSRPIIVVGDNEEAVDLRRHLEDHPELGFVVAATATRSSDVPAALEKHDSDSVIIAVSALGKTELNRLTRRLLDAGVHVHLSCGLTGIDHRRLRPMPMAHEPLFYLEGVTVSKTQLVLSRALDIAGSVVGLILTLPVLVAAAIAIKAQDGGPALFRHQRIGRDGRPFTLYKLRTMVPDAESRLASAEIANLRDGPLFKSSNDSRVTKVGRILRATSVDELPQLLNVLLGSMSLVGPRPALAHEVEQFDAELLTRLRVKPGITGLWQVEARHDPSFEAYRRLDLFYLENWSLDLDLVILLTTVKGLLGQAMRDLKGQWRSALPSLEPRERAEIEAAVR